jgi:hypothetical protein
MNMMRRSEFTFIERSILVVRLAILDAIAVPNCLQAQSRPKAGRGAATPQTRNSIIGELL